MSDERETCRYCGQPVANQHDWDTVPEGEGVGLCWGPETCMSAEEAVDRLRAENGRLREALDWIAKRYNDSKPTHAVAMDAYEMSCTAKHALK